MMYGDQWNCSCGWANFFLRQRCRNCGKAKHVNAAIDSAEKVIAQVTLLSSPSNEVEKRNMPSDE